MSTATIPAAKPPKQSSPQATPEHVETPSSPTVTDWALLKWMLQFIKPVKWFAVVACVYLIVGVWLEVRVSDQMRITTDVINKLSYDGTGYHAGFWEWLLSSDEKSGQVRTAVLALVLLVVTGAVVGYLRNVSQMKFSMNMVYYLREATYDKVQHAGFTFHDTISTGQLINRALTDLQNVRVFLQTCVLTILEIVLIVSMYIIYLMMSEPWVAAIALIPLPIWTWYILRFSRKVQPVAKAAMEAGDRNTQIITENIAGVHVIKAFATEQGEVAKFGENCDSFYARVRDRILLFANFNPIIRAIATAAQLGLTFATAAMILRTNMSVGDFLFVGAAMNAILGRLQQVSAINDQYQSAIVSAKRLHEILNAQPAVDEKPEAKQLPAGKGGVSFENVTFGYDPAKPVLQGVNVKVKPGSMIAIVGPTGSGKSTLVSLLARFYDPQQGRILIDGVDIREVKLSCLRTQVTYVFQETFLFSDTVANNIAYGKPDATPGEIEIAARLAQAHEFIDELPKKYQTVLAERGSSLSGGQRQRLAIARAILKNPRILVLDDATAAVDSETEDLIRRGMKYVMQDCTTFVIAHRLSTAKAADLVIVLEEGRITQMGTHEQLLEEDGHYREIAAVQLYSDEEREAADSPSHMRRIHSRKTYATAAEQVAQSQARRPESSPEVDE